MSGRQGGRQAHGRPLLRDNDSNPQGNKRAKRTIRTKALDAFAIAADEVDAASPRGPRARQLDVRPDFRSKRRKGAASDSEGDGDDGERPRKRIARGSGDEDDEDSDSVDWRVGVDSDDDSEIDPDEAFGESDGEELGVKQANPKSQSRKVATGGSEEDTGSEGDDGSSLGSEAVDLATALDQWEESDQDQAAAEAGQDESSSEEGDGDSAGASSEPEVFDDEDIDDSKLDALRGIIGSLQKGNEDQEDAEPDTSKPKKVSRKDLVPNSISNPHVRKSLKLLQKEDKNASKPGVGNRLDVPLPQRQQAKLDRSAAYEKTNETLDRWTETVKRNRRAEHLVFPLAQSSNLQGVNRDTVAPITQKTASNELESTITAILEESGLGPSAPREVQALSNEKLNKPSLSEKKAMNAELRRERQLKSRQDAKAKRIKKIKSKAYHRVHRKAERRKERKEIEALERAAEEGGGLAFDEQELEDLNRQRAIARVGGKHKESKWAKQGARANRAAWDEEFREGLRERNQKEMDLRRRIEGKTDKEGSDTSEDEDDSGSDSDPEGERKRLLHELDELNSDGESAPVSRLMSQPFMQRSEARRKAENDAAIKEIRKELASEGEEEKDSEPESADIGRRSYGQPAKNEKRRPAVKIPKLESPRDDEAPLETHEPAAKDGNTWDAAPQAPEAISAPEGENLWDAGPVQSRKSRKYPKARIPELQDGENMVGKPVEITAKPLAEIAKEAELGALLINDDTSSEDDSSQDESQADDEAVAEEFAAEKAALIQDEGDKVVDETLPGWGSWVGYGVSKREQQRHKGQVLKKLEGIKAQRRRDKGDEKVMINEKIVKKNSRYLATQLPHPFETRQQYERSLRLPVGEEWVTKGTFQDATKPRVILKRGIIAPMIKPMYRS